MLEKLKKRKDKLFNSVNKNLFIEFVRARLKMSDHKSILGMLWSLLMPAIFLVVLYMLFRERFGQDVEAYPLFLLIGIVCVNFFVSTTTASLKILSSHRSMVVNSIIPRETLILSALFIPLYKFVCELFICWLISIYYGLFSFLSLFLLVPLLITYIAFVLGVGLFLTIIYCYVRDIEHIWMLASRLVYFVTPVFYSLDSISSTARRIVAFANPVTPFVSSFREIFMGSGQINTFVYFHGITISLAFFLLGYWFFLKHENSAIEQS